MKARGTRGRARLRPPDAGIIRKRTCRTHGAPATSLDRLCLRLSLTLPMTSRSAPEPRLPRRGPDLSSASARYPMHRAQSGELTANTSEQPYAPRPATPFGWQSPQSRGHSRTVRDHSSWQAPRPDMAIAPLVVPLAAERSALSRDIIFHCLRALCIDRGRGRELSTLCFLKRRLLVIAWHLLKACTHHEHHQQRRGA